MTHARQAFSVASARFEQLPEILAVQHRAFTRVARQAGLDPHLLEPVRETRAELEKLFHEGTIFLVAVDKDGTVVGSVRGSRDGDVALINRLVVETGWERRGMATALMDAIEATFADARLLRLFTGEKATGPLALYLARGYSVVSTQDIGHVVLAWLEKQPVS